MKKNYYAIIPANVRYDKELRPNSKLLYGEITALCNDKGFCWATNSYFAKLYEVNKDTISKWISELSDKGYIKVKIIYKKGTRQIVDRYIQINHEPVDERCDTPIDAKSEENNTSFNTTINNTSNKDIVEKLDDIPYKKIIDHLNLKTNKNYRHTTRKTKDLIKARFNEGFKLHDFIRVIEIKNAEWRNDEKMKRFLRPETLFGTKFESYLNQEDISTDNPFEYDPNVDSF